MNCDLWKVHVVEAAGALGHLIHLLSSRWCGGVFNMSNHCCINNTFRQSCYDSWVMLWPTHVSLKTTLKGREAVPVILGCICMYHTALWLNSLWLYKPIVFVMVDVLLFLMMFIVESDLISGYMLIIGVKCWCTKVVLVYRAQLARPTDWTPGRLKQPFGNPYYLF